MFRKLSYYIGSLGSIIDKHLARKFALNRLLSYPLSPLQGHKQWVTEVQFLGVVEHPNLVKLVGYCAVDGERGIQRLLVYEFMQNKSLEDHLFNKAYPALTWERRLQIVLGAAQGLAYLHEELEVQVCNPRFFEVLYESVCNACVCIFCPRKEPVISHTSYFDSASNRMIIHIGNDYEWFIMLDLSYI